MEFGHKSKDCCNRRTMRYYQCAGQRYTEPSQLINSREFRAKKELKSYKVIAIVNSFKNLQSLILKNKLKNGLHKWRKAKDSGGRLKFDMIDDYVRLKSRQASIVLMIRARKNLIKKRLKSYFDRWNMKAFLESLETNFDKYYNESIDLKHIQMLNKLEIKKKGLNIYGDESNSNFNLFIKKLETF